MRRARDHRQPLFRRSRRGSRALGRGLLVLAALLLAYLSWPYTTLWRLDRAVRANDEEALAALVDLDAVRVEIKKKLNKDARSRIGPVSDRFIQWLQEGIQALGNEAVDRLVTSAWVREQLLAHSPQGAREGFLAAVAFAFFDAPNRLLVRIGPAGAGQVRLHLERRGLAWRLSSLAY